MQNNAITTRYHSHAINASRNVAQWVRLKCILNANILHAGCTRYCGDLPLQRGRPFACTKPDMSRRHHCIHRIYRRELREVSGIKKQLPHCASLASWNWQSLDGHQIGWSKYIIYSHSYTIACARTNTAWDYKNGNVTCHVWRYRHRLPHSPCGQGMRPVYGWSQSFRRWRYKKDLSTWVNIHTLQTSITPDNWTN